VSFASSNFGQATVDLLHQYFTPARDRRNVAGAQNSGGISFDDLTIAAHPLDE